MMLRLFLILCLAFSLIGCVTQDNVRGIMEHGLKGSPRPVTIKNLNDYELCAKSFDAFSSDGRSSAGYRNTLAEIRNRGISCKQYARAILAEKKLAISEARLEAAEARADRAEEWSSQSEKLTSDMLRQQTFCTNYRRTRQYQRTGRAAPGCY